MNHEPLSRHKFSLKKSIDPCLQKIQSGCRCFYFLFYSPNKIYKGTNKRRRQFDAKKMSLAIVKNLRIICSIP